MRKLFTVNEYGVMSNADRFALNGPFRVSAAIDRKSSRSRRLLKERKKDSSRYLYQGKNTFITFIYKSTSSRFFFRFSLFSCSPCTDAWDVNNCTTWKYTSRKLMIFLLNNLWVAVVSLPSRFLPGRFTPRRFTPILGVKCPHLSLTFVFHIYFKF